MPILLVAVIILVAVTGCGLVEPTATPVPPTATPTLVPTATATPTVTPSPSPTATPTITPTPAPLSPAVIFDRVSPAVVYIETAAGSGSGVLIAGVHIVTNAHVVWPFSQVRVVLADGTEHLDVPVEGWDLMADLALVGPIETDVSPIELVGGEELIVGSDVYLIGYPGEVDEFPKPTITRGLISRLREWEPIGLSYFQTDAMVAGGQSGGVLVSELGVAIGISGFTFSEADFALVASAADIRPRVEGLLAGEDVAGLGDRRVPLEGGKPENNALLHNEWAGQPFIINEPVGTEVEFEISGSGDVSCQVLDVHGYLSTFVDEWTSGTERGSIEIELDAPYFMDVYQNSRWIQNYIITSSHNLIPYDDPDDGELVRLGQTIAASLDYPGDWDYFEIYLDAGELINIRVDSVLVDPYLTVGQPGDAEEQMVTDDDSAGGLFGTGAELTYETPHNGKFVISVSDALQWQIGGYYLTVDVPYDGAPTPMAPKPTATPIASEFGEMALFEGYAYAYSIEYPADWVETTDAGILSGICQQVACRLGSLGILVFLEEDAAGTGLGFGEMSLEEYVDLYLSTMVDSSDQASLVSRETITTAGGEPAEVLVMEMMDGLMTAVRFVTMHDGAFLNVSYLVPEGVYEQLQPMIEYTFSTYRITGPGE